MEDSTPYRRVLSLTFAITLLLAVGAIAGTVAAAEAPAIVWQRCLGGTDIDRAYAVQPTTDGGYVLAGTTWSNDGDVSGLHGSVDAWVARLDGTGGLLWQRCLGGSGDDWSSAVEQTADGGYVVAGATTSTDGDVEGQHGDTDAWVVKLNATGELAWQTCLGGSTGEEVASSVRPTADGGFVVAGYAESNDGDVAGNHGEIDAWVVKLDAAGGIVWQRCLGGSGADQAGSVRQTADGGYILAGTTRSVDGDVSGSRGGSADLWVVRLDAAGGLAWQRCLGGTGYDGGAGVQPTADGGYIVTGSTQSADGDVGGFHGGERDVWVVKLDPAGGLVWQRCLGGTGCDVANAVEQTADDGYVVVGETESRDGDVGGRHGATDAWAVKLNATGDLLWQRCLGGSSEEQACAVQQTTDGGLIVAGMTWSNDGDVTGNHGRDDAWVVKLGAGTPSPTVLPVPGGFGVPTVTKADGLYDDVNGNGRRDFADVVLYFNQMGWIGAHEPVAGFDYNGNGQIDFADVVRLFNRL